MENSKPNEVNLLDILVASGKLIKNLFKGLLRFAGYILKLLYRNKILTAIIFLLAIVIGQYMARPSARKFNVDAMCVLYGPEATTISEVGKQLSLSSPRYEATSLANKLSLPDSIATKVAGVEFFQVIDYQLDHTPDEIDFSNSHSLEDTLNLPMRDYIYMRIKVKGTRHAQAIGEAMLKYLNTNVTIQNQYNVFKAQLNEKIVLCDAEMLRLDSLAKITYFRDKKPEIKFESNKLLIGNNEVQLFYNDLLNLQANKAQAMAQLEVAKQPVVIPSGFVINPNSVNGRVKLGVYSLFIGLIISTILGYYIENRKKWLKYLQEK